MRKGGICIDCGGPTIRKESLRCKPCGYKSKIKFRSHRECGRNSHLKKKYGMTLDEFYAYWDAGRGQCFICGKSMQMPLPKQGQGLDVVAVDHDHITGKIRGLLCNACNKGLGLFKDDIDLLNKAAKYLENK